ncbi:MAG: hypothetical protein ACK559_05330, partial [bacterium]
PERPFTDRTAPHSGCVTRKLGVWLPVDVDCPGSQTGAWLPSSPAATCPRSTPVTQTCGTPITRLA